jgi:hypothetical protein
MCQLIDSDSSATYCLSCALRHLLLCAACVILRCKVHATAWACSMTILLPGDHCMNCMNTADSPKIHFLAGAALALAFSCGGQSSGVTGIYVNLCEPIHTDRKTHGNAREVTLVLSFPLFAWNLNSVRFAQAGHRNTLPPDSVHDKSKENA